MAADWFIVFARSQSCLNLVFGYSRAQPIVPSPDLPDVDMVTPPPSSPGTDLITALLSRLALVLNVELDIAAWSRLIGLIAIGSIILANMRNVLFSVNRVSSRPRLVQGRHSCLLLPDPHRSSKPPQPGSARRSCSSSLLSSWSVQIDQSRPLPEAPR